MDRTDIRDRVESDFSFHPATAETGPKHEAVRSLLKDAARELIEFVPEGREQSLALTKLEEAMYWANAGIARGLAPVEGA